MNPISFKRHRFPASVIVQAVRWYFRFTLSIRVVEELMAERGIEVSREAIRCWVIKFGPLIAANLRRNRPSPTGRWHFDEVIVKVGGRRVYLWGAVDDENESRSCSNPRTQPSGSSPATVRSTTHSISSPI